jgi:hypothetical protein
LNETPVPPVQHGDPNPQPTLHPEVTLHPEPTLHPEATLHPQPALRPRDERVVRDQHGNPLPGTGESPHEKDPAPRSAASP